MRMKKESIILFLIFTIVFSSRLFFSLQTTYFSDDPSYFVLRQVETIEQYGSPILDDDLSYSGRTLLFSPIIHYLYAFFYSFHKSPLTLKILSNLFASLVVFGAYMIALHITKKEHVSLITALLSGFLPIYYSETVNSLNVFSLFIPLTLFSIYFLLKLKNNPKKYAIWTIFSTFLIIIITPLSIIFILGLFFFLFLLYIEDLKIIKSEFEIIFVSLFLFLWFNFLLYKKALIFHGMGVIWQNTPQKFLDKFFISLDIIRIIYSIGLFAFIFGIYIIYFYITKSKSRDIYLLLGMSLSLFILLWLKLIAFNFGMIILGMMLSLLTCEYLNRAFNFLDKTVIAKHQKYVIPLFILIIFLTSILPSFSYAYEKNRQIPDKDLIEVMDFIRMDTPKDSTIFSSLNDGHLITYYSQRKNVIDSNYLFIKNIDKRQNDVDTVYTTLFFKNALSIMKEYDAKYLLVTKETLDEYRIEKIKYVPNECFIPIFEKPNVTLYEVFC